MKPETDDSGVAGLYDEGESSTEHGVRNTLFVDCLLLDVLHFTTTFSNSESGVVLIC